MVIQTNSLTSSTASLPTEDSSWVNVNQEEAEVKEHHHSEGSDIEVEDLFVVVPESLTFAKIINILNNAIEYNNYKELDTIVRSIEDYDGQPVKLDNENLKNFCLNQLNLDLEKRSDHRHIYSNILSQYSFDQVKCNYSYPVKELVLLAIAANDKLAEKYQDILFAEGNLSLLPLLIGSQKYIAAFIERFPDLYIELKDQVVQLNELNKIGFFSIIALRKEQNLLNSVLVEDVLGDLKAVLQEGSPDSLYGVLETASLAKNKDFMKIVLDSLERYIDDQAKKDLLKKCIVTFLETVISQEHVSIVEYLCRERIEKKGSIIQEIYKEAFADEKIIEQIKNQVLKNIDSAGNGRKEKKQKIYDLVLQAASCTGSTDFIIKVLDLIKNDSKFSGDTDRQTFLQNSLVTILDNIIREKHSSIIQNVYTNFILKLAENSGVEFLTIQQRYQNACHTFISVDNNVAGQFNEELNEDDSNLEQDKFEITDIQEEQRPGILGPNKTEIAGFSQEKLLEIINFVKIGYYVSDYNLNSQKFSELEERSYKVPAKLKEEGYKIVQFYNVNDGKQYRHAGYVFIKDKEITIVYRGSRNLFDYITDIRIPLICAPGLLPEGGKIHSGFYSLFKDSWGSVYEILRGYANDQKLEIKDFKINLTGHSMGGAIATIAALCLSVREGAEDLHVATFASPRVFDPSAAKVYEERLGKKTIRVVNQSDFIPSLPSGSMGYKHVGEQLRATSDSYAHSLDIYRNLIINIEPDQFKSDNSVSIYYYPSYLVTAFYNVFTAPSYLIPNTHSNGDEQYFKQVKNKHKDASLSEMMKYSGSSNEQKVVIYEDSEPGEDGFITFVMPSLPRHERGEGLKVNVPDIAFFVNSNYYLSGDTISLRLLKTLIDNYPGSLALMKKEKKSNKLNGGSSSTAAISTLTIAEVSSTNSSLGDHSNNNVQIAVQSDENQQMNAEKAGSSNTPGIPEQILVPSNEKELVASTGYGMGDVITKTGNAGDLRVATLGTQQVVPHGGAKILNKFYKKNATGLSVEFIAGNISEIVQKFLNAGISQVVVSTSTGSSVSLGFNDISKASQGGLQKIAKALMDLFTRGESNSRTVNAITNFSTVKTPALEQENNTHGNDQQPSDSVSNIQSDDVEVGSTTINDQSTSIISSDGEDKQIPVQQAIPIVLKKSEELAAQTAQDISVGDDVAASVISNDNHSDSSEIQLQATVQQFINKDGTAPSVQLAAPKSLDKNSGKKDTQPKLIPTGVPLVASKDSNQVNNVQGNSKQPSYPDKNNPAPQNAKSKLPVIAAAMLAITGVATGIAIAVYLKMLMVGIAVGACCLVAATIIYYCNRPSNLVEPPASCNRPSSLLEGSNVKPPASASIV